MLLYIQRERKVRKSWVVKVLKIEFVFFNKYKKLVNSTLTEYIAENIRGNIMHIALRVNIDYDKNYMVKINIT